jgi:hypothetical protein
MPYADVEVGRKRKRDYQRTESGKAAHAAAIRAWRARNSKRLAAHNAVSKALLRGHMEKAEACFIHDCNDNNLEAHHPDYDRPLDVVWLCQKHHKEAHAIARSCKSH